VTVLPFEVPTPLQYFATLVADDEGLSVLEAAITVAQDECPWLDAQSVLLQIDELGQRLKRRIHADAVPLQRLRLLNNYFFHELAFSGNVNDYYDPRNSYLHEVLDSRRGIPITLALIYAELAQAIGLQAVGVNFPGHFLVKLHLPRGEVVIDPFTGHSLSKSELEERILPFRRRHAMEDDEEVPLGRFLQPAAPRDILARLLRNLKTIHRRAEHWHRLLAVQERLVVLLPQAWEERRDRGLALAELGACEAAADDLAAYLEHCGDADDARELALRLQALRAAQRGGGVRRRWH
jgi:regulator of sirC expression with transglutaminase-like and TPR domain